ncbi:hypothetical protein [Flagellimonas abyssi]|uniref:Uncharacterized protein n=1 Tax=Flagellimonas abyssi TaxID=2864871 RepID=A0ABS7EUK8_9FLAO|nr:hypothetical protein [Allomuricauda abyssi]MBW8201136.1 hypothetical protein [Allomuricauda abyssi]
MIVETEYTNRTSGRNPKIVRSIMELHYKTYQKIRIYLDKIQYGHDNLTAILNRTAFSDCEALIMKRLTELHLMKAQLVEFCINPNNSLPYVPSCRCEALIPWYGSKDLFAPSSPSGFKKILIEADKDILREADYIISDENAPLDLKKIFINHSVRFKNIQESKCAFEKEGQGWD